MAAKFILGIDLGTTNSVLAFASLADDGEFPRIGVLPIPQLVAAGTIENRTALPSFLYLGAEAETKAGVLDVPWKKKRDFAVGEFARKQGVEFIAVSEADQQRFDEAAAESSLQRARELSDYGIDGESILLRAQALIHERAQGSTLDCAHAAQEEAGS